jgi:colanic acid/amylovoran biosynthesis glycosyltransferase
MKTVIHFKAGPYLPITETWIYSQIEHLSLYKPVVYATETINLDIFPTEGLRKLKAAGKYRLLSRLLLYASFFFYMKKDKPALIHAHFGPSGHSFLPLKKLSGTPLITSFYGYDLSKLIKERPKWKNKYKALFKRGELFLVEGSHMKKSLMELGCPEEKVLVQHLGIDLEQIPFVPRKTGSDGPFNILIAGSFREKKGLPFAVEAFGRLQNNHPSLELRLTVIGDSSGNTQEERQKNMILETIRKYRLSETVRMVGYQPYTVFIEELYRHHIFLSPSICSADGDTEGGVPVSIIEASASGMPVVSTMHCDIPEVIIDGESGYLAPEKDVDGLVQALELLVLNTESWGIIGRKGREHIEEHYDVRKQIKRLEEIYDTIEYGQKT